MRRNNSLTPKNEMNERDELVVDCWAYGIVEEPTISKALAENRVVKITPDEGGKFEVREMCDEYFGATLTAEQLTQWGRELIALSSTNDQVEARRK